MDDGREERGLEDDGEGRKWAGRDRPFEESPDLLDFLLRLDGYPKRFQRRPSSSHRS